MPIQATVILDSGCFLPVTGDNKNRAAEIGYFQSSDSIKDITVSIDGKEIEGKETNDPEQMNLGTGCRIEVRHLKADGNPKQDGAKCSDNFHNCLLHMEDLYGVPLEVDPKKFDCILRFESGLFCPGLIKQRKFKEHKKQPDGNYTYSSSDLPKLVRKPIMHNMYIHFKLGENEAIELARDGQVFWSSKGSGAVDRIEIEIVADNTTADRFYREALKEERDSYWLPNQGDPPPICPMPPCEPPDRTGGTLG